MAEHTKPASLLFVTSFYPPLTGGGASRIYDFAKMLSKMGFLVTVLTFFPFLKILKASKETTGRIMVIRVPSLGFKHPLDQIFTSFFATLLTGAVYNFQIISVPMGEPCIGVFLASKVLGRKMAVDIRDEWEEAVLKRTRRLFTRVLYNLYRQLFNGIYRKSAFVVTVTPTLVKRVKERGVKRVHLLPNGADVKLFHPVSAEERLKIRKQLNFQDDFLIVYAGRVGWYYRVDMIIRALKTIVEEHGLRRVKLLVIGGGEKVEEYSSLARELGLHENVTFLGERKREEVAQILPCCDVGVVPFDEDPIWLSAYTTKFFEYCASGLPTIVSVLRGGDLEKLIIESNVGFVVPPLSPTKMVETILKAYYNRDDLGKKSANARKLAVERFNREKISRELANLIKTGTQER